MPDLPVAAPDPAEVIQRAMDEPGTFCAYCARPLATEEDWKDYPEGGGEHLCWDGGDAGCTDSGTVTLRRDDVRALLVERQQDKERIEELSGLLIAVQVEELNGRLCARPEDFKDRCCPVCRDLWRRIDAAIAPAALAVEEDAANE